MQHIECFVRIIHILQQILKIAVLDAYGKGGGGGWGCCPNFKQSIFLLDEPHPQDGDCEYRIHVVDKIIFFNFY